jgi:hypothetical protein
MSLSTQLQELALRAATEHKAQRTLINGNAADLSALSTTAKNNLVGAINEVFAAVAGASGIDDATVSPATSWSSTKTQAELQAAIDALVGDAPGTLDTLRELAAALGDNANLAAELSAAVAARVRYDAEQTLTAPQQAQARANIGAVATADVGDTNVDFVGTFEAGLI